MFGKSRSPLGSLKSNVLDDETRITTVLRQAKVLGAALNHEPLKTWLNQELSGYAESVDLPEYRVLPSHNLGTFCGVAGMQATNVPLPMMSLPDYIKEMFRDIRFANPIKEIEVWAKQESDEGRRPWPAEAVMIARNHIRMANGMQLVEAWQPTPGYIFEGVLDAVRNRLLDFLLELEQIEPEVLVSEEAARNVSPDAVTQVFHTTIRGGHNVVAAGKDITQSVKSIIPTGDSERLIAHLEELGVPEAEARELIAAVKEDGPKGEEKLGRRARAWLGRATEKIAEGAWKTTTTAAPQVIVKAISQYLGWS